MKAAENIAIYWGAFNPPTLAHAQIVQEILKISSISHVIISPSWERADKNFQIPNMNRKKLIETFTQILSDSWLDVSLDTFFLEWKNNWLTTTAAEEEYFREKLWVSPHFVFGTDVAPDMLDWSGNDEKFIETKLQKIFVNRPWYDFDFEENGFDNYILLDIPDMLAISSSLAREMIQNKQSVKHILHPNIVQEIHDNNLYN
jgi:nicotinate (nicotinamide) nucleotide adenylyltransferase